jgi:hypothetical protein
MIRRSFMAYIVVLESYMEVVISQFYGVVEVPGEDLNLKETNYDLSSGRMLNTYGLKFIETFYFLINTISHKREKKLKYLLIIYYRKK